jgi:hypothetical protein
MMKYAPEISKAIEHEDYTNLPVFNAKTLIKRRVSHTAAKK